MLLKAYLGDELVILANVICSVIHYKVIVQIKSHCIWIKRLWDGGHFESRGVIDINTGLNRVLG
jgi:hypothetical protein